MRISALFLVFTLFNLWSSGQTIKGKVFDKQTRDSLCYATIYLNGTFVGTSSDQNGKFELDVSKYPGMPLTISAIGYYSLTLTNYLNSDSLTIYLEPKTYELGEATVKDKSLERKRKKYLKLFRAEFLGTTNNASKCIIRNEQDITFNYTSDSDTIIAYALNPLQIVNSALGYQITYYLDKFEYYKKADATYFSGNMVFQENMDTGELNNQLIKRRREIAYLGSRMHFIRALWSDDIESTDFVLLNQHYEPVIARDIVAEHNGNKFIRNVGELYVNYLDKKTTLEFYSDFIYFEKNGFFNPGIKWSGDMGFQRVADWLPYEYSIDD